tara:strand:+ start:205 stop:645 length:441 start_codon:yes stop_codon:yes gene_type:complete
MKLTFGLCLLILISACQSGPGLLTQNSSNEKGSKTPTTAFQLFTDIPIPVGTNFDVQNSLILGSGEGWTGRLIVTLSKNPADAFAVYTVEMPEFGWKPIASVQSETSVLTFTRGDRAATIEIEARAITGSLVRITMTPHSTTGPSN